MKKTIVLFIFCFAFANINLFSQAICECTSDPNCIDIVGGTNNAKPGEVCPETLPVGTVGVHYSVTLTIIPPTSAEVGGITVNAIAAIKIMSVQGLPTGFSYCQSSEYLVSGQRSCVVLSGTTTESGHFPITLNLKAYGSAAGIYFALPNGNVTDNTLFIDIEPGVIVVAPIANFYVNKTDPTINEPIQFTDMSINEPTSWLWNFGDQTTSIEQNPAHTYQSEGNYTVSLTVSNAEGANTKSMPAYIHVHATATEVAPVAQFTVDKTNPAVNESIQFTDMSANAPTSWQWDFGDGLGATTQSPAHTYHNIGDFTVTLIAENGTGKDTITKENFIHVKTNAIASNEIFNSVLVYPNPANNELTVEAENVESITILDVRGLVVYYGQTKDKVNNIDISNLPNANYIVKVKVKDQMVTKALLKQ